MGPAESKLFGALMATELTAEEAFVMIEELSHEWATNLVKMDLPDSRERHWIRFGINIAADALDRQREI